jgi:hypothetical protein
MPSLLHLLTAMCVFGASVSAATFPHYDSIAARDAATEELAGTGIKLIDVPGFEFLGIDGEKNDVEHSHAAAPFFHVDSAPDGTYRYHLSSDDTNSGYVGVMTCETSSASPTYSEIDYVVWKVSKQKKLTCFQDNPGGSKCTLLQKHHGGEFSICGDPTYGLPCEVMAWAGAEIKKRCGNDATQRAGGYFSFGSRHLRAVIH